MIITPVHEYNHEHEPGGSPKGGQFARTDGLTTEAVDAREAKIRSEAITEEERKYARQMAEAELGQERDAADGDSHDAFTRGGKYTPERAAIHDKIIEQYFRDRAQQDGKVLSRGLANPHVIMMGGPPAAGKSTARAGLDLSDFVVSDPDMMKDYLKPYGYNGKNAFEYQRESIDIAEKLSAFAIANKMNLLYDRVFRDPGAVMDPAGQFDGVLGRLAAYRAAGYSTELRLVTVPLAVSLARSINRFRDTGRYVPASFIKSIFLPDGTTSPERSVRLALGTNVNGKPLVDKAYMYDGVTKKETKLR